MAEQGRMEQLSEQPCFAGLLATVFGLAANILASIHQTVKKHSQPSEVASRHRDGGRLGSRELTGDAQCNGLSFGERRIYCTLRLTEDLLMVKPWEGSFQEEALEVTGADVESTGVVVTLSRNSVVQFTMAFDSERLAGLWATKLAVACGNSESISKLFSTQRRRIYALEQRTAEAQMNNEEVERCLNFLSREYVEMRYQVRRQTAEPEAGGAPAAPTAPAAPAAPAAALVEDKEEEEPLLIEDIDPPRLPSEPEKEPVNSARATPAKLAAGSAVALPAAASLGEVEEPKKGPCLLGSSPSHPKRERQKSKKELPVSLKDHVASRSEHVMLPRGEETPSLPSPPRNTAARAERGERERGERPGGRSTRELKKEPLWSPKAFSPYHGTPIDCPGLDRRGHKLAMAHQRAPGGRATKDGHSGRKSNQGVASKTPVADKTSVAEKR